MVQTFVPVLVPGWQATRASEFGRAEQLFREAVQADPRLYDAWGALVRLDIQARRLSRAESTLARARAAGLPLATLRAHEALIAAMRGDVTGARQALSEVSDEAMTADPTVADVVNTTRRLLGAPGAAR